MKSFCSKGSTQHSSKKKKITIPSAHKVATYCNVTSKNQKHIIIYKYYNYIAYMMEISTEIIMMDINGSNMI